MKIGELAQKVGCTTETIRFYEKQNLLLPALRGENNYRYYQQQHLKRLKLIRNCRAFDMNLEEIHGLIALIDAPKDDDCHAISLLLKEHAQHIQDRIIELTYLAEYLEKVIKQCDNLQQTHNCKIVSELMSQDILINPLHHTHLR